MRHATTFTFLGLLAILTAMGGCMSDRAAKEMNDTIAASFNAVARSISGSPDLGYATVAFCRRNGRWPKDYTELSNFVQQSDGYLYLGQYDRVDFTELPEGGLEICSVLLARTNRLIFTSKHAERIAELPK